MVATIYVLDVTTNVVGELQYDDTAEPISGGEGNIYFSTDNKTAIKFYNAKALAQKKMSNLERIIKARPDKSDKVYEHFAWPNGLVVKSNKHPYEVTGITMPHIMTLTKGVWVKELIWYRSLKGFNSLEASKKGTLIGRVKAAIGIAQAIRYLALKGYAQADISGRNFLINPNDGLSVLIDLDGLVDSHNMESAVLGTFGYMAPEIIIGSMEGKPVQPDIWSDRHALGVMLYELLLMHHPLKDGPMPKLSEDPDEDDKLRMGKGAIYKFHCTNHINRPKDGTVFQPSWLGPELEERFKEVFVDGLDNPTKRPAPWDWERALGNLLDELVACKGAGCWWGAFSVSANNGVCPVCNTKADEVPHGLMHIMTDTKSKGFFAAPGRVMTIKGKGIITGGDIFKVSKGNFDLFKVKNSKNQFQLEVLQLPNEIMCHLIDVQLPEPILTLRSGQIVTLSNKTKVMVKFGGDQCILQFKVSS